MILKGLENHLRLIIELLIYLLDLDSILRFSLEV